MLLYGGIGLLAGGLVLLLLGDKIVKDPATAASTKKQAPILMVVGAVMIGLVFLMAA